ncbi:MAG: DUF1566 domain-containing protein [Leptospiraceae bacterium]|nr:DUF1566 domain-containing protein [Leptospiraceae bacterium]
MNMFRLSKTIVLLLPVLFVGLLACKAEEEELDIDSILPLVNGTLTDNGNGTVSHILNGQGLTWLKCAQGQVWNASLNNCAGTGGGTTYGAVSLQFCSTLTGNYADCTTSDATTPTATSGPAFTSCDDLVFAGFSDWRMPGQSELVSLASGLNRTSFLLLFPQTPDDKSFWTRDGNSGQSNGSEAYSVNFATNTFGEFSTTQKDSVLYVRCIRNS